jgi:hypothetical protein
VRRNVVADCVFHAAAATVISSQTAKRLVISVRQCVQKGWWLIM